MAYDSLKSLVRQYINTNAENEITGQILQNVLITMIDELGSEYSIEGIATPTTNPGSPSGKAMYFASQAGTYTYFDGDTLPLGIHLLVYNGTSWSHQTFFVVDATPTSGSSNLITSNAVFDAFKNDGGAYDVSVHFPTGGVNGGNTYDLADAIAKVPSNMRKGGMSIKFVQSSDNKYVQYRLMPTSFSTTESDWQGVDEKPTLGSEDFVESGGVALDLGKEVVLYNGACIDGTTILDNNKRVCTKAIYVNGKDVYITGNSDFYVVVLSGNTIGTQFNTLVDWTSLNNVKVTGADKYISLMFGNAAESAITKYDLGSVQLSSEECFVEKQTNKYARIYNENYGIGAWADAVLNVFSISKVEQSIDLRIYCLRNMDDDNGIVYIREANRLISDIVINKTDFVDTDNNGIKKATVNNIYCSVVILVDFNLLPNNKIVDVSNGLRIPTLYSKDYYKYLCYYSGISTLPTTKYFALDYIKNIDLKVRESIISNDIVLWAFGVRSDVLYVQIKDITDDVLLFSVSMNPFTGIETFNYTNINGDELSITIDGTYFTSPVDISWRNTDIKIIAKELDNGNNVDVSKRLINKRSVDVSSASTGYYDSSGTYHSGDAFRNITIDVTNIGALKIAARTGGAVCPCIWKDGSDIVKIDNHAFYVNGDGVNLIPILIKPENASSAVISWAYAGQYNCTIDAYDVKETIQKPLYPSTLRYSGKAYILPVAGQSLSIGAESTPALSTTAKYNNTYMVTGSEFKRLWSSRNEMPGIGLINQFIEGLGYKPNSNEIQENIFITPNAGSVGIDIAGWAANQKATFLHAIEVAVVTATQLGYTSFVPAMAWIQGEADISEGTLDWKEQMIDLYEDLNDEIKTITGQSEDIKIILYQSTTSQCLKVVDYGYSNNKLLVPTQQMELVRDDARFIAGVPTYSFETVPTYNIHITNKCSYMLGAYLGKNAAEYVATGYKNKGLVPTTFTVNGNNIVVAYNVPKAPMKIDIDSVAEVAHYGYTCVKFDGTDIITKVSVCYDKVYIECSESPVGCKLRYGLNGAATHTATEDPSIYNGGRLLGGRGNLRDSEESVTVLPTSEKCALYNWAYCFETLLT